MTAALLVFICSGLLIAASAVLRFRQRTRHRQGRAAASRQNTSRYTRVRGRRVRREPASSETPPRRSAPRAVLGLGVALAAIGAGVLFFGVEDRPVPEQRGVGIVSWVGDKQGDRQVHPAPGRGLALSAAIRLRSCGEPVDVTLIATGTAEFWADHARRLRKGGTVEMAIPDLGIRNVRTALGEDGKLSAIAPLDASTELASGGENGSGGLRALPVRRLASVSVVGAEIPRWGRHLRPVLVRFDADWLQRRSALGSCFLRLPALAGFPTVLSAREIRGEAVPDVSSLQGGGSIFVVSSKETGLEAYYRSEFETTRGVTSIELGSNAIRGDLSAPAPDTNVRGAPSWTCSSTPPRSVRGLGDVRPGAEAPEILQGEEAGALSSTRLGTAISEHTCATFAVVEHSSAAVARDIAGLLIGALFSFGVGLFLDGFRRNRRPADA